MNKKKILSIISLLLVIVLGISVFAVPAGPPTASTGTSSGRPSTPAIATNEYVKLYDGSQVPLSIASKIIDCGSSPCTQESAAKSTSYKPGVSVNTKTGVWTVPLGKDNALVPVKLGTNGFFMQEGNNVGYLDYADSTQPKLFPGTLSTITKTDANLAYLANGNVIMLDSGQEIAKQVVSQYGSKLADPQTSSANGVITLDGGAITITQLEGSPLTTVKSAEGEKIFVPGVNVGLDAKEWEVVADEGTGTGVFSKDDKVAYIINKKENGLTEVVEKKCTFSNAECKKVTDSKAEIQTTKYFDGNTQVSEKVTTSEGTMYQLKDKSGETIGYCANGLEGCNGRLNDESNIFILPNGNYCKGCSYDEAKNEVVRYRVEAKAPEGSPEQRAQLERLYQEQTQAEQELRQVQSIIEKGQTAGEDKDKIKALQQALINRQCPSNNCWEGQNKLACPGQIQGNSCTPNGILNEETKRRLQEVESTEAKYKENLAIVNKQFKQVGQAPPIPSELKSKYDALDATKRTTLERNIQAKITDSKSPATLQQLKTIAEKKKGEAQALVTKIPSSTDANKIKDFQQTWIDQNCPNNVCPDGVSCIGKITGGSCVPDGSLGDLTQSAIETAKKQLALQEEALIVVDYKLAEEEAKYAPTQTPGEVQIPAKEITPEEAEKGCNGGDIELCKVHKANVEQKDRDAGSYFPGNDFMNGRSGLGATGEFINKLNSYRGLQGISSWMLPDEWGKEWNSQVTSFFDNHLSVEYLAPKALCDSKSADTIKSKGGGESAVFIETAPGQTQSVASIHAEKSADSSPALCAPDVPCSKGECHDDGICYENNVPVEANLYKINWMVKAPSDNKATPYKNDQDQSVLYNVEIRGGPQGPIYLYPANAFGTKSTLGLKNGETDKDLYITYSPHEYSEICILFEHGPQDIDDDEVTQVCTDFATTAPGSNPFGKDISSGSSGQPSQRVADVGRKQI